MTENELKAIRIMGGTYAGWERYSSERKGDPMDAVQEVAWALGYEGPTYEQLEPVALALRRKWSAGKFRKKPDRCLAAVTQHLAAELGAPGGTPAENPNEALHALSWHFFRQETNIVDSLADELEVDYDVEGNARALTDITIRFSLRFFNEYPQQAERLAVSLAAQVGALL